LQLAALASLTRITREAYNRPRAGGIMQFWGIIASALLALVAASAQPVGAIAAPPSPSNGVNTGHTSTREPSTTFPDDTGTGQRPILIAGTVLMADGSPLTDRVKIERVCNGVARTETYADKKGHFSFEVGQRTELADASMGSDANGHSPFGNSNSTPTMSSRMATSSDSRLWGCELRAALAGFGSDAVSLSGIHYLDNPNLGTIILHRLGVVDGLTISVVSALAPKDARKSYEKGRDAEAKRNLPEAQKEFEKAASLYPQYSAAWFELGRVHEQADQIEEARKAYQQAISAEPKFIQPHEQLCRIALREAKWPELVDLTDQWLRLDPQNSPDAYYLSSIGNLQTQHFEIAEKNAREAIRLDPGKRNMRARYVLGLALAQKHDFAASAEAIRSYLDAAPDVKDRDAVQKQLDQIEQAAQENRQSKVEPSKPQ
jgi:tetratricopeptide (TPR) repeat protein